MNDGVHTGCVNVLVSSLSLPGLQFLWLNLFKILISIVQNASLNICTERGCFFTLNKAAGH